MKRFYCSVLLILFSAFSYAQYSANSGIQVRIISVPILTDSLGRIDDYIIPVRKKITDANEELNKQTLTLIEEWRKTALRIKKSMQKNDSSQIRKLITPSSEEFKKLEQKFKEKFAKLRNNNVPGYMDSLGIRLDFINGKILHRESVKTFDLRITLGKLAQDFDNADSIKNNIREMAELFNDSLKGNKIYGVYLKKIGMQLNVYNAKVLQIKEQLRNPLKIETVYNDILEQNVKYQSFMQENISLGSEYGLFGKIK